LHGLPLNQDPLNLSLLSSGDYRYESPSQLESYFIYFWPALTIFAQNVFRHPQLFLIHLNQIW
jgi:hypothetical protein